ncbi:MAG: hypothetical protein JJU00_04145 [Opitutales bacterium]|nr:hypothetical protein [Opitutales bacterium]
MKPTSLALAVIVAAAVPGSAQLQLLEDISGVPDNIFTVFVDALSKAVAPFLSPENPSFGPAATQFSFGYAESLAGGTFLDGTDVELRTGATGEETLTGMPFNLTFKAVRGFPAFLPDAGLSSFHFGLAGFTGSLPVTVGLTGFDSGISPVGTNGLSAFNIGTAAFDSAPASKVFGPGDSGGPFAVYAQTEHAPGGPEAIYQGNPDHWRIFELVDDSFGGQGVYVLSLRYDPANNDGISALFVLSAQTISPVPEPAAVGFIGVAVLLLLAAARGRHLFGKRTSLSHQGRIQ